MTSQVYLMVNEETGVVDNTVMWDGNPETWEPPAGYLTLVQATTLAKVWGVNQDFTDWVLVVDEGEGQPGFTWDGTYAITNDPKPVDPPVPPEPPTEVV